jgi:hypothetical protein
MWSCGNAVKDSHYLKKLTDSLALLATPRVMLRTGGNMIAFKTHRGKAFSLRSSSYGLVLGATKYCIIGSDKWSDWCILRSK